MPGKTSKLMKGALILTFATFVVKVLSAVYRVPFQNIVGNTGFYIYQQVYPIYGIAVVLATTGFPVAVSKLVADQAGNGHHETFQRQLQAAFIILMVLGFSLFSIIFLGAAVIAGWMGDAQLAPVIQVVAFPFLFMPLLSYWRGLFQGEEEMRPTAASQVVEQVVRVGGILILSTFLVSHGYSLYIAGSGAWIAAVAGEAAALIMLGYASGWRLPSIRRMPPWHVWRHTGKTVLIYGIAFCFSGMLLILLQLADSFQLYSLLIESGWGSEEAKVAKGVFDRGQPLVQLGSVAATSLSLALVPAIAGAWSKGNWTEMKTKVESAVKLSLIVGLGAAAGLMNIIRPTNIMLFKTAEGSGFLAVLAVSIFFISIILTLSGTLQGTGRLLVPAKWITAGVVCKWAGNHWMIPLWGPEGAAWATVISLLVISLLLIIEVKDVLSLRTVFFQPAWKILLAAAGMSVVLQAWISLSEILLGAGRAASAITASAGVLAGGVVYVLILLLCKTFNEKEVGQVPYLSKIFRFK